jgi:hypothetical protein
MDYEQIAFDLQYAPAVKLLKAEHAPLIISFLYQEFKREQRISLPLAELIEHLEDEIERISIHSPSHYPRSAQTYISEWADEQHRYIRILAPIPGKSDRPMVELTADTERAIGWLEEMHKQAFVGTESRFLLVVQMIRDMVYKSTEDPQQRLAQLEQQRDELQQQIDDIRQTGKVDDRYSSTQVRERFLEATALARQLLRDFHLVEDRFREIARDMQERQTQPGIHKGSLVEYVLDADGELKSSDQGRSFYAFWDFLMAPSQHDSLYMLLDELRYLPDLQSLARTDDVLRYLPAYLIAAGEQVIQSNSRIAEQLRRLLDEEARAESRRVRELALSIKQQARQVMHVIPNEEAFLELEGAPEISLVMERSLWEPTQTIPIDKLPTQANVDDLSAIDFTRLHTQFYINQALLNERVEHMLEVRPECTLVDLLKHYPLEKGLSELLGYCTIAAKSPAHVIDATRQESIPLSSSTNGMKSPRVVILPRILYRRSAT